MVIHCALQSISWLSEASAKALFLHKWLEEIRTTVELCHSNEASKADDAATRICAL